MSLAVNGVCSRPSTDAWNAWVSTLREGDEVIVCDWLQERAIYKTKVGRITPTGRIHLLDSCDRLDRRTDWRKGPRVTIVGTGDRFIAPVR